MTRQRLYNGVRFPMDGPCLDNVARIDHGARPMIHAMRQRGLRVDLSHFAKMEKVLIEDMDRITEEVRALTGVYCNLDSGDQVSKLLFKTLGLKQARAKMTKSGDRESAENEVLVAIQHDHPAVAKILVYKELSKLKGTYVSPMPRLAVKVGPGHWRMYPKLGDTRVPSGRLNCIAKGTHIEIVRDVAHHPKGVPIEDVRPNDLAYTYTADGYLVLRPVRWAAQTGRQPVLRLHWRGSGNQHYGHVDVTGEHRVRLTSGDYIPAKNLESGDRVFALSRGTTNYGYARLWPTGGGEIAREHQFIWSQLYGSPLPEEIHHIDGNQLNNTPNNLQAMTSSDHHRLHALQLPFTVQHRQRLRNAYYRTGIGSKTAAERLAYQDSHRLNLTKEWLSEQLTLFDGMPTKVASIYGIDYATLQKYMRLHGLNWRDYKTRGNHVIVAVEKLEQEEDVYDLEIEETHNFIAGELCVHNCKEPNLLAMPNRTERGREICEGFITDEGWTFVSVDESQIEPRVVAHRSGDTALRNVYFNEEDIYSDFAIRAFKLRDERYQDVDGWHYPGVHKKLHRFPSKTCILAAIYDVTNIGLLEQMPIVCAMCGKEASDHDATCQFQAHWTEANCQAILTSFYHTYPEVLGMRKRDHQRARQRGYIWDELGRLLHVAAVRSVLEWVVSAALREVGNFPIQSTAQSTVKLTMAAVHDDMVSMTEVAHPLLQIHDELLFECRQDVADEVAAHVSWRFETCVELDVPIKASSAQSLTWGSIQK